MSTIQRCDAIRVGGLGVTFALHALAILVVCIPAVLPEAARESVSPPLQWVMTTALPDESEPASLPAPPSPPPRPPRSSTPPPAIAPIASAAVSAAAAIATPVQATVPQASTEVSSASIADPTPAPAAAPVERALAYARVRDPVYPLDALRRGEQGVVTLRVWVTAEGVVDRVEIERGSGSSRLDRAARDAVRQWRFHAPRVDGVPVAATGVVPIVFRLPERA